MHEDSTAAVVGAGALPPPAPASAATEGEPRAGSGGGGDGHTAWAGVAVGLEAALRLRAPVVHASTPCVRRLAGRVCRGLKLGARELALVDACARVRDIGMIALPDAVLSVTGPLSPGQWEALSSHPAVGAGLLESLPQTASMAPIVRSHHERWDGQGYPDGLRGEAIPLLSRVLAACDVVAAVAIDRPHRPGIGVAGALERAQGERGKQLDPRVVDALEAAVVGDGEQRPLPPPRSGQARRSAHGARPAHGGRRDLRDAILAVERVPAFGTACERVLAAVAGGRGGAGGDAVAAIESDTGLTVAVLGAAQPRAGGRALTNVADAVIALGPDALGALVKSLPRISFPWRTRAEAHMHSLRVHAQVVARAVERIARELRLSNREELVALALLHDVGKLALARAEPDEFDRLDSSIVSPEERVRHERARFGLDHASLGALLLERWGLPPALARAVAEHHRAEADDRLAGVVRLADLAAHYARGDLVDRRIVLRLSASFGLALAALREIIFDLPHAAGSQRRRAQPSPLSDRETAALRLLGEGKRYKQIAGELGVAASTVRSHLHNAYAKLGVDDRAQAVLRAVEMAWI